MVSLSMVSAKILAQFNDGTHYLFQFRGTGNINKTNDGSSFLFNNGFRFSINRDKLELNTNGGWIYGEDAVSKTNNDFSFLADLNYLKDQQKLYYWALTTYEKSLSLKINDRFQIGGGLGFTASNTETFNLIISDGLLYENTKNMEPDTYGRETYEVLRNSFRIKFRISIKDRLILEGNNFLQNALEDRHDYIVKSATSASVKLNKWLSLTTTLLYNRLNLTGTENLMMNYGLSIEKYF
jgi:hypothetical protein